MKISILAIAETTPDGIHPVSDEVAAFAGTIAEFIDGKVTVCVIGGGIDKAVNSLATRSGYDILEISVAGWKGYNPECHVEILAGVIADADPAFICVPHTARGIDFAPVLAARIAGSCITGVEKVTRSHAGLTFTRRVLNGKQVARVSTNQFPAVITVQPGAGKPGISTGAGKRNQISVSCNPEGIERLGMKPVKTEIGSLNTADVIVAAGNGIGGPENLELIERLAGLFSRSAIAGSRPVCDRQWLPYGCQVGVTGAVVRPRLYIACGISGATQHIAGMRESGFIVAVNTDPKAAILNYADIFISEDLRTFIPIMMARMEVPVE